MSLEIGIVGTGGLGTHLGRQFNEAKGADLVAIADVSDENRRAAGEKLEVPAAHRYEDLAELLEEESLDGVAIATPHTLHYDQVVTAIEAGLHVLCEKPLTTDLDDARDLVERAEQSDSVLMVGYQRHLSPVYRAGREWVEDSARPKFVTAEITQDWIDSQEGAWRSNPDLSGGGQLYDTGSHLIDAVLWMTELTPTTVSAEMLFHDDEERVDTQAVLDVTFEEDTVASVSVSGDAPRVREHIHIWGDDGAAYIDGIEWKDRELELIDADGEIEDDPEIPEEHQTKAEAFVESIETGTEPPATARDAFYVTAVTEAAYESARSGERVGISLSEEP
jgi:predicted dehydrogenase